jgi:rhodanese-related sulfurtransferase
MSLIVATLALGLIGCGQPRTTDADIVMIDRAELEQLQAKHKQAAVLLDVRPPDQYAAGHIPGSINMPLAHLHRNDALLRRAPAIIVYANGWTDPLSPAAAKTLMRQGYSSVYEFRGGVRLWRDEGLALDQADRAIEQTRPESQPGPSGRR